MRNPPASPGPAPDIPVPGCFAAVFCYRLGMTSDPRLNLGEQPIARILADLALKNGDLVAASGEFLTRKMVVRACKGRRLTPHVQGKILRALNRAAGREFTLPELFNY